jgi:hypothetical protein
LVIFGASAALFEARSWVKVGSLLPTSSLYKPKVLGGLKGGSAEEKFLRIVKAKPFLCKEAIKDSIFADHFWELCSFVFNAVSFDGFLRYIKTHPDHFVSIRNFYDVLLNI